MVVIRPMEYDALATALSCRRLMRRWLREGRRVEQARADYDYWTARAREEIGWAAEAA